MTIQHRPTAKSVDVDKRKPVKVSAKGITIQISPTQRRGQPYWTFSYYIAGKRTRCVLKELEDAKSEASKIINGLTTEPDTIWTLDEARAREAYDADKFLEEVGLGSHRMDNIARDWAEAMGILDGKTSLAEACRYWLDKCGHVYTATKPAKAIESFIKRKTLEGTSEKHLENMDHQCNRFARTFGTRDLHTISVPEIRAYLLGMQNSSYARRYHRNTLALLFDHAIEHAWCPMDHNPARAVTIEKGTPEDITYFKPKEVKRLFTRTAKSEPDLIPYITFACRRVLWDHAAVEGGEPGG